MTGNKWFESEQPSLEVKEKVRQVLNEKNNKIDVILSHTCPYKYLPREMFIDNIDQKAVDNSTEYFLDEIEETTAYQKWYCGHFHTDKEIDNIEFMYHNIKPFTLKKR